MEAARPRRTPASRTRRTSPTDVAGQGDADKDEATSAPTQTDSDTTSRGAAAGEEPSTTREDSSASSITAPSTHETEGKDIKVPDDEEHEYPKVPSMPPVPSWNSESNNYDGLKT